MSEEIPAVPDPALPVPDSPGEEGEAEPTPEGEGAEATPGEPAPAEEEKEEDEGKKKEAPAGRSEAFEKLLAKYGGDYDKLATGIFEQYNSAARTHEELVELRAMLEELRSSQASTQAVEKVIAEDPDVREVNADLASLNDEATTITAEMKGMVTEYQKLTTRVAKLEGALSKADDNERYEISQDLRDAKRDLSELQRDYKEKERDYKRAETRWKELQKSLRDVTARARSRVDMERADGLRLQREALLTKREYQESLREEAEKYGIGPSSPAYNFIDGSFKARLSAHMRALQAQGHTEGIDIPKAVSILMKEYAEASGLNRKFVKTSTEKANVATPRKEATPVAGQQDTKKEGEMTGAQWKARARQLMP